MTVKNHMFFKLHKLCDLCGEIHFPFLGVNKCAWSSKLPHVADFSKEQGLSECCHAKFERGIPDSKSNNFFSTYHLAKVCQIEISNIWQWYEMLMSNHTNYRTIFNFHPLTSTFKKHIDLHQPWRAQNIPPLARNASCNWWMRRPDVFFWWKRCWLWKPHWSWWSY